MRAVAGLCRQLEPASRSFNKSRVGALRAAVVAVNLDLGSDNALFIRGQGGGLNWDKGQALNCVDAKTWIWAAEASSEKLEFQLLLNDEVWERGEPHIIEPGDSIEITPDFEWPEIPRTSSPETVCRRGLGSP